MARAIEMLLTFSLIFATIWACKDGQADQLTARQGLDGLLNANSYPTNPWVFPYYYNIQPRVPFAGYANPYEGRIPFNRKPPGYFANVNADYYNSQEGRFGFGNLGVNLFNTGLLSNLFTPLTPLANLLNRVEACTSPSGEAGMCSTVSSCSSISGRPSGSCTQGRVCCINVVNACGNNATRNNTYWQSPSTAVSSPCSLTVHLDNRLAQQASPICQIRLDFVSFTTAPPTDGTCTDTFTVEGATTVAPTICGVNSGQHMYLDVPSSATTPTDVKLIFKFATGTTTTPSWNIKIAMLPCGAAYLAPADCLQYFTSATGKVKSFNWQDAAGALQLNNQNYNICFRTELVAGARATQMCVKPCTVMLGNAFFLTGTTTTGALTGTADDKCSYDFLAIAGGFDPVTGAFFDRYCGSALNTASVCTKIRPFRMTFGTDASEPTAAVTAAAPAIPVSAIVDTANTGFCLEFQEK